MHQSDLYKDIGSKIRDTRKAKGFTQQFLADKMNVERTSITNLENGKQRPPLHFIYELCNFLDADICKILPSNKQQKENQEKIEINSATRSIGVSKKTYDLIEKIKNLEEHDISLQKTGQLINHYQRGE